MIVLIRDLQSLMNEMGPVSSCWHNLQMAFDQLSFLVAGAAVCFHWAMPAEELFIKVRNHHSCFLIMCTIVSQAVHENLPSDRDLNIFMH